MTNKKRKKISDNQRPIINHYFSHVQATLLIGVEQCLRTICMNSVPRVVA